MQASTRRLLSRSIDYAGLFPPAQLGLEESLREFQRWSGHEFSFVIERFCCPVDQLPSLWEAREKAAVSARLSISAIGRATSNLDEWNQVREREAALLNQFQSRADERVEIGAYEVRVPTDRDVEDYFDDLQGFSTVDVFAELPWGNGMSDSVAAAAEADWLALKARTGGPDPRDVPTGAQLAEFIWSCMSLEVPFKLTAGLHQPLCDEPRTHHGFVNALTAAVLAYAQELPAGELESVLSTCDPAAWKFGADGMLWRDHAVTLEEIDAARGIFTGIGSCSVEEPYQELRKLGWA